MKDLTVRKKLKPFETPETVSRNKKYQNVDEILSPLYDSNDDHALDDIPTYLSITQLINLNASQIETLKQIIKEHNNEIINNNNLINYVNKFLFNVGTEIYITNFNYSNFTEHNIYKAKIINKGRIRRCPWQDIIETNGIKHKEDRNQFKIKLEVLIEGIIQEIVIDIISFGRELINPEEYYINNEIKYPFFIPEIFAGVNTGKVFESINDAKKYIEDTKHKVINDTQKKIDKHKEFINGYTEDINNIKTSKITFK